MTEHDKTIIIGESWLGIMQTLLTKMTTPEIESHLKSTSISINYFFKKYDEWKKLRENKNSIEIKRFESLHGIAFMQLLSFFENLLEEKI